MNKSVDKVLKKPDSNNTKLCLSSQLLKQTASHDLAPGSGHGSTYSYSSNFQSTKTFKFGSSNKI